MTTPADNGPSAATNINDDFDIDAALDASVDQEVDAEVEHNAPTAPMVRPQSPRPAGPRTAALKLVPPGESAAALPVREQPLSFLVGDATELSEALARDLRGDSPAPVVHDEGCFWRYDPAHGAYTATSEDEAQRIVSGYSRKPVGEGLHPKLLALSFRAIKDAVQLCANNLRVAAPDFFKNAVPGVAFQNVFIGLGDKCVEVRRHDPSHRARHPLPFDYDAQAACPRWHQFLAEVFPPVVVDDDDAKPIDDAVERAALLQEFCGACLFGLAPRYGLALVLEGSGENGKSVALKVLPAPFPRTSVAALAPQRWMKSTFLAELAGKRLNAVAEMPAREIAESDTFKAIVTGDVVTADQKYKAPFQFTPSAGHIFACNALPATRDHSDGYWRRFAVIKFNRRFTAAEQDPTLAGSIIREELSGLVAWMIEGTRRLLARGRYAIPASSHAAKEAWKLDADQVQEFIAECIERCPPDTEWCCDGMPPKAIAANDLYAMYKVWAEDSGHKALSKKEFGKRAKAVLPHGRCSRVRYYWGEVTRAPQSPAPRAAPSATDNNV